MAMKEQRGTFRRHRNSKPDRHNYDLDHASLPPAIKYVLQADPDKNTRSLLITE